MIESCTFQSDTHYQEFNPEAKDILTDEDLLELFRIIKKILRKKPDIERIAKLYFCMMYAMGDMYPFYRPQHSPNFIFKDISSSRIIHLKLPAATCCCLAIQPNPTQLTQDQLTFRPYTHFQPTPLPQQLLIEPKQRGFYYQDDRILKEPVLLQRYAEQGVLTQASLLKKRKKPEELIELPPSLKKTKIPHRHGEFSQRRDDIIGRLRTILMTDLEQKAQRLPLDFTIEIERADGQLERALQILTVYANLKPHQDNGLNQNGIYYNHDYYRLYLAFLQFQQLFGQSEGDMKQYRPWIEPGLTETHWAAFRRNVMVGERISQLTEVVGKGTLLMTKELSGSKLHLTFTNHEWDDFIEGIRDGRWDDTIDWSHEEGPARLVQELRLKFASHFWFTVEGRLVPPAERKARRLKERQQILFNSSIQ